MIDRPPLMGLHEIQQRLQLSRQRIQQLAGRDDFPQPYQQLAMGRVWLADDIESWIRVHRRDQVPDDSEDADQGSA